MRRVLPLNSSHSEVRVTACIAAGGGVKPLTVVVSLPGHGRTRYGSALSEIDSRGAATNSYSLNRNSAIAGQHAGRRALSRIVQLAGRALVRYDEIEWVRRPPGARYCRLTPHPYGP